LTVTYEDVHHAAEALLAKEGKPVGSYTYEEYLSACERAQEALGETEAEAMPVEGEDVFLVGHVRALETGLDPNSYEGLLEGMAWADDRNRRVRGRR
jgi:hypothetical protein